MNGFLRLKILLEMKNVTDLVLPWPPSVNHYWGQHGKIRFVTQAGLSFRKQVFFTVFNEHVKKFETERLSVIISAYPPDKRIRDLDNVLKSLLDALKHAGVYKDDYQIDRLEIERKEVVKSGFVKVVVKTIQ